MVAEKRSWLGNLWDRTVKIATMYTGTFIVVMFLNQLLFFGLCLNPICLVAAMPHVLLITAFIGSWLNKETGWGNKGKLSETKTINSTIDATDKHIRETFGTKYQKKIAKLSTKEKVELIKLAKKAGWSEKKRKSQVCKHGARKTLKKLSKTTRKQIHHNNTQQARSQRATENEESSMDFATKYPSITVIKKDNRT